MQLKTYDLGYQHRDRLSQHRSFGLDAAHTPAKDAERIDHRGVRVGADQRVGVGSTAAGPVVGENNACQALDVDLVHNAGVRRHDLKVAECSLAPAQETVALDIAGKFDLGI